MNTELTVLNSASLLSEFTGPDYIKNLNLVRQRYLKSGLWAGVCNLSTYQTTPDQSYFTLSRHDESILGINFCGRAVEVMNIWTPFNPDSIGFMPEDRRGCGQFVDIGNGYVSQTDISEAATLRLKIEDPADAAKEVRLFGLDENGREIYDSIGFKGIALTSASPSSDTTQVFTRLTGVQNPFFQGYVTLWQVVSGVETQIAIYAPGERVPCYRRYRVPNLSVATTLRLYCRQRFVNVVAPTDYVTPGNVGALKFGFLAMKHEDAGRIEEAAGCWAMGEKLLNEELAAIRGSAITTLRILGNDTLQAGYGYGGYGGWGNNFVN